MLTCPRCGGRRTADMHEITTLGESAPRYLMGTVDPCAACGSLATPIQVEPAPSMTLVAYGPPVPSPEDLLRAVGVL